MSDKVLTALERWFPILANVCILLIQCFWMWLSLNIQTYVSGLLGCAVIPLLILIGYSKRHHFCLWHRLLLLNIMLHGVLYTVNKMLLLIGYEFIDNFFVTLCLTEFIIVTLIGLFLLYGYIKRYKKGATLRRLGLAMWDLRKASNRGTKETHSGNS